MSTAMPEDFSLRDFKFIIFDVDGTLYDQEKLRRIIAIELLKYYILRPRKLNELRILMRFRSLRETNSMHTEADIDEAQYAQVAKSMGVRIELVKKIVEQWIYSAPLRHLGRCKFPSVSECIDDLQARGFKVGIFSDYPVADKLAVMNIHYDFSACSTDKAINRFKPDPAGLLYLMEEAGYGASECLFIGDRQEKDGEAAVRAGMSYLIIAKENRSFFERLRVALQK